MKNKIRNEFYAKTEAMTLVCSLYDLEMMEKMLRPCKAEQFSDGIVLVTFEEDNATVAFNLSERTIEKEIKFTEEIRRKANEIAGKYAGHDIHDAPWMQLELREIGITLDLSPIMTKNPDAGVYNSRFTYKGMPAREWCVFFDIYDADPNQKFSCYFS